jgi:hypothetical protein
LIERSPAEAETIDRIADRYREVDPAVVAAKACLTEWISLAGAGSDIGPAAASTTAGSGAGSAAASAGAGSGAVPAAASAGAHLVAALTALGADLAIHLDEEARYVLPLAARQLTAAEWAELPPYGMKHFSGDKVWLILGLVQEAMTAPQRRNMIIHMPAPVRAFWASAGRRRFEAFIADLRR